MTARIARQLNSAGPLCSAMSDSPIAVKSQSATSPRGANVSSPIGSINYTVAVDPIKYVRVSFSFDDFEPDGDVVDNDGMPGEPSSPCGSVFWLYSHLIILSFWFEDNRAEAAPCLGRRESNHEVGFRSLRPPGLKPRVCTISGCGCSVAVAARSLVCGATRRGAGLRFATVGLTLRKR